MLDTNALHEELSSVRGALDEQHGAEVPDVEAQLLAQVELRPFFKILRFLGS